MAGDEGENSKSYVTWAVIGTDRPFSFNLGNYIIKKIRKNFGI